MKTEVSYTKMTDKDGKVYANYFVKNVVRNSELENKLIELGYIDMGWGSYKTIVRTNAELEAKRTPILSFLK